MQGDSVIVDPTPVVGGGLLAATVAAGWGLVCGAGMWFANLFRPSAVLLADSEWRDVFTVLSPVVAAIATWALMEWRKTKAQNRADKRADDETVIGYYKDLVERKNTELSEAERERLAAVAKAEMERELREKERELRFTAQAKLARYEVYAESLEERLDEHGEKYRKWRDTPLSQPPSIEPPPKPKNGSGIHKKTPEGGGL